MTEQVADGPHERTVGPLLPCPCCGASDGYRLAKGSTYRWWSVQCAACGQAFGECASDRRRTPTLLNRHRPADEHWNKIAAHADRLRALAELVMQETGEDSDGLMLHEPREALVILRRAAAAVLVPNARVARAKSAEEMR